VEVGVFSRSGGPVPAGVIVLVSPANKDRAAHRDTLVTKCAAYVQARIGVVLVDVVTGRAADLHADLLTRLGATVTAEPDLFAAAYRTVERDEATALDIWREPVAVGRSQPTLPL